MASSVQTSKNNTSENLSTHEVREWTKFYKTFLATLSDGIFLSSIDMISFKDKYVRVKKGFWKTLFSIRIKEATNAVRAILAVRLKRMFIERFARCSATKIKEFLMGKIRSSYMDFRGILIYDEHLYVYMRKNMDMKVVSNHGPQHYLNKSRRYCQYLESKKISHNTNIDQIEIDLDIIPGDEEAQKHFDKVLTDHNKDENIDDLFDLSDEEARRNFEEEFGDTSIPNEYEDSPTTITVERDSNNRLISTLHEGHHVSNFKMTSSQPGGDKHVIGDPNLHNKTTVTKKGVIGTETTVYDHETRSQRHILTTDYGPSNAEYNYRPYEGDTSWIFNGNDSD